MAYLWCAIQTLVCPCPFSPYLYSHLTYRSFQDEGTSLTSASGSSHKIFPADNFNIFAQFSFFESALLPRASFEACSQLTCSNKLRQQYRHAFTIHSPEFAPVSKGACKVCFQYVPFFYVHITCAHSTFLLHVGIIPSVCQPTLSAGKLHWPCFSLLVVLFCSQ